MLKNWSPSRLRVLFAHHHVTIRTFPSHLEPKIGDLDMTTQHRGSRKLSGRLSQRLRDLRGLRPRTHEKEQPKQEPEFQIIHTPDRRERLISPLEAPSEEQCSEEIRSWKLAAEEQRKVRSRAGRYINMFDDDNRKLLGNSAGPGSRRKYEFEPEDDDDYREATKSAPPITSGSQTWQNQVHLGPPLSPSPFTAVEMQMPRSYSRQFRHRLEEDEVPYDYKLDQVKRMEISKRAICPRCHKEVMGSVVAECTNCNSDAALRRTSGRESNFHRRPPSGRLRDRPLLGLRPVSQQQQSIDEVMSSSRASTPKPLGERAFLDTSRNSQQRRSKEDAKYGLSPNATPVHSKKIEKQPLYSHGYSKSESPQPSPQEPDDNKKKERPVTMWPSPLATHPLEPWNPTPTPTQMSMITTTTPIVQSPQIYEGSATTQRSSSNNRNRHAFISAVSMAEASSSSNIIQSRSREPSITPMRAAPASAAQSRSREASINPMRAVPASTAISRNQSRSRDPSITPMRVAPAPAPAPTPVTLTETVNTPTPHRRKASDLPSMITPIIVTTTPSSRSHSRDAEGGRQYRPEAERARPVLPRYSSHSFASDSTSGERSPEKGRKKKKYADDGEVSPAVSQYHQRRLAASERYQWIDEQLMARKEEKDEEGDEDVFLEIYSAYS
ncbi:hypothetical protein B0T17DRAFT_34613 [Bombardia bombarda]|uniref:Uncharacterized protein n=1 Tax=Bombardia bombarda TaxID=252184 RepID=A0AA40CDW7_9PEZI|nr:hypothetical protein B0T17DRAFT_34613 [Bombardia bombarda]